MKKLCTMFGFFFCIILLLEVASCKTEIDTASPEIVNYTVTFDSDGGSPVPSQRIEKGKVVREPEKPTKDGYEFNGWYYNDNRFNFTSTINSNITLKAKWRVIYYHISYILDGGYNTSANPDMYNIESDDIFLAEATKKGHTFSGWSNGSEIITKIKKGSVGDITLTAHWDLNIFDVTFDSDNGSELEIKKVEYRDSVKQPDDPVKENYSFAGWYNNGKLFSFSDKITDNITLKAKWILTVVPIEEIVEGKPGDVLLNDGTVIRYNDYKLTFTDEQKSKAVGVFVKDASFGAGGHWLGIYNSAARREELSWATKGTSGNTTSFPGLVTTRHYSKDGAVPNPRDFFEADDYWLDNWNYILRTDPSALLPNYPAFYWVYNYASKFGLKDRYAEDWYLPTITELSYIYQDIDTINKVLSALGGTTLHGNYWSSSQIGEREYLYYSGEVQDVNFGSLSSNYSWFINFDNKYVSFYDNDNYLAKGNRDVKHYVCCVRPFKTSPAKVKDLVATYDAEAKEITVSWKNSSDDYYAYTSLSYKKSGKTVSSGEQITTGEYVISNVEADASEYEFSLVNYDQKGDWSGTETVKVTTYDIPRFDAFIIPSVNFTKRNKTVKAKIYGRNFNNPDVDLNNFSANCSANSYVTYGPKFICKSDNLITCYFNIPSEIGDYEITVSYGSQSIKSILHVQNYNEYHVGDVLLNDGRVLSYKAISFTDEQKSKAVGVLFGFNEYDAPIGWLGIDDTNNSYEWAQKSTKGYKTKFNDIICSPKSDFQSTDVSVSDFTGDRDGIDNWLYICSEDSAGSQSASENYPAFSYVNHYAASKPRLTDEYSDGWYMPSIAELYLIYENKTLIDKKLKALDGSEMKDKIYWSSSLPDNDDNIDTSNFSYALAFSNGNIVSYPKSYSYYVCSVLPFDVKHMNPYSVGDVLLNDGTIVSYDEKRYAFTSYQKSKAVGIMYGFNEHGEPCGWLGIGGKSSSTFKWTPDETTLGYTTLFEDISCERNDSLGNSSEITFSGDTDGNGNWEYICSVDTEGSLNAEQNYPPFNYVNNYSEKYNLSGEYSEGWYLPSIAELCYIYENKTIINTLLEALGGKILDGSMWSSSQYKDSSSLVNVAEYVWSIDFRAMRPSVNGARKIIANYVCCVHDFDW